LNYKWVGVAVLLAIYFPVYFLWKKNKVKFQDFMETQAALDVIES